MGWSTVSISEKPADYFQPEGNEPSRGLVVFLHGYDGITLRDNSVFSVLLQEHQLSCVCPHGGHCCWTDQVFEPFDKEISPIDFLKEHTPEFAKKHCEIGADRIAVCGVELGGQGALQLAYRHARRFPIVAAISPKVDFESWYGFGMSLDDIFPNREAARQATATLHVHPLDWPKHQLLVCDPEDIYCHDGVRTLISKLNSTGIPFESDVISTRGGFGWDYANFMADRTIRFISDAFRKMDLPTA